MQPASPTNIPMPRTGDDAAAPAPRPYGNLPATAQPSASNQSTPATIPAGDKDVPAAATDKAQALARLIAAGRQLGSRRFAALEPYRDVLLTERRGGASIRLMTESLAKLGVGVSEETLRVWLLRQKMPKRRKPRVKPVALSESPTPPAPAPTGPVPVASGVPPNPPAVPIVPAPVQPLVIPSWQRKGPRIARDNY